jgi:uncharacterized Zn finger protein
MIENANKLKCGNCGNEKFRIYRQGKDPQSLFVECTECGNDGVSIITVHPPALRILWHEGSAGVLSPSSP